MHRSARAERSDEAVRGASLDIRLAAQGPFVCSRRRFEKWLEKQRSMISSGSTLAAVIRYALNHCQGPTRFLGDGRLELDANPVENAIRPICLTRKCALRRS
ncbi:IS66 family transposase [Bradyrhizobium sp. 193]|uniref:IS66 family transposase n=1 Tax=Bradyrhizobium sp. 193 TaxID=2782661 RepID=UPI001FFA131B|nr:IS66 family transposase [Bradyrhizobium sp. 193]